MGTNYYVEAPKCPHCGRGDDSLHLGKSSGGWRFSMATHSASDDGARPALDSLAAWEEWLTSDASLRIVSEYGEERSWPNMLELMSEKANGRTRTPYSRWPEWHGKRDGPVDLMPLDQEYS